MKLEFEYPIEYLKMGFGIMSFPKLNGIGFNNRKENLYLLLLSYWIKLDLNPSSL